MKPEIYSCMRMLDDFKIRLTNLYNIGSWGAIVPLQKQYKQICEILKENLSEEQYKMIHEVRISDFRNVYGNIEAIKKQDMEELLVSISLTSTYLHSLEMSIDKELIKKKIEVSKKEKELEIQQKEIESYKKLLKDSFEAIKQFPELQRSKMMEEIKKSHREIENNTNPNTKSQKKNETTN